MNELLYVVEKDCPICQQKFPVTKVRNRMRMLKQDTDFCTYYDGLNPYYYVVWVCPHCGYAAQDSHFSELTNAAIEKIQAFLKGKKVSIDFGGERTLEQALKTYKLAIFYAEMINSLPSQLGGLYLKLAWLFREANRKEEEKLALTKAVENYDLALMKETLPIGNMSEMTLIYLVGELMHRIGKYEDALTYLSKVVNSPQARQEKRVLDMARDMWHQVRDEIKEKQAKAEALIKSSQEG